VTLAVHVAIAVALSTLAKSVELTIAIVPAIFLP
jgi:hypothetical protein